MTNLIVTSGITWLWDKYGKDLIDSATDEFRNRWAQFKWIEAEAKYRERLKDLYGTTRLLGNPKPIMIENIFVDAYVLDRPTAFQRFNIRELQSRPLERESLWLERKRLPALRLAIKEKRLFILGKPGSGKTTFLKYMTLLACNGKITKTPIFVSLKEWGDWQDTRDTAWIIEHKSETFKNSQNNKPTTAFELIPFIVEQFKICGFPEETRNSKGTTSKSNARGATDFVYRLLNKGDAIVFFDGLDEVVQDDEKRNRMISALATFAKSYPQIQIFVTCRIAATEYFFDQFTYLEIADFNENQIKVFVSKWYKNNPASEKRFWNEFKKAENEGLEELAKTPLLLAMLCLTFDETLSFPTRRVDLYKDAFDALLKKWDTTRGIQRDEVYRKLSPRRKEQLLARLAAQNFETGTYFISKDLLSGQISDYLKQLPNIDIDDIPAGDEILRAIEARHGILVECAHNIYSFSHLTFQEYLTARYVIEHAIDGALQRLIANHLDDRRWKEVFLLTVSLLDNADFFFEYSISIATKTIQSIGNPIDTLFEWTKEKAYSCKLSNLDSRIVLLFLVLARILKNDLAQVRNRDKELKDPKFLMERARILDSVCAQCADLARSLTSPIKLDVWSNSENYLSLLGLDINSEILDIGYGLTLVQCRLLEQYMNINSLLTECLQLAVVSNRLQIESKLLSVIPSNLAQ